MDGDWRGPSDPARTATVATEGGTYTDFPALAGEVAQVSNRNATDSHHWHYEVYEYWRGTTANGPGFYNAVMVRRDDIRTWTLERYPAAPDTWRETHVDMTYSADHGLLDFVNDRGEVGVADNTCTNHDYAINAAGWTTWEDEVRTMPGDDCSFTVPYSKRTFSLLDSSTSVSGNDAMTDGNPTSTYTYRSSSTSNLTRATYDSYGRQLTHVNARGFTTRTAYSPTSGYPTNYVSVKNPLGHETRTTTGAQFGQVTKVVDVSNNLTTTMSYDSLGRLVGVRLPDAGSDGSYNFVYPAEATNTTQPSTPYRVRSKQLHTAANFIDTYTYHDGFGRQRETQTAGPNGGRIVVEKLSPR